MAARAPGKWDAAAAIPMTWTEGDVWTAEAELAVGSTAVEYKYIIRAPASGEVVVWQPCENLSIDLTTVPAGPVVVKDGWEGTHELLRPAVATPAQVAAPSAEAGAEPIAAVEAAPAAEVKDSPTATIAEQEVKAAVALAAAAEVLAVAAASMDEDVIMAAAKAAAAASSTSSAAAGSAQAEALRSKSEGSSPRSSTSSKGPKSAKGERA
ncbi:hypothetical protein MNEG_1845 [Monoraphidium neglectum]|uniref:CBM20 domain-containing protein n=1 Tax=Monoraphidium neglectum TaxID=145388 RepID=A0A0D2N0Q5_9CHLO|nr:hypothetical protein MNEG_1845 [Monoraphidium neglectum]KIZ06107.1 hypothetical protein MNEG_1845 [Monoraphidium neglectum]|eukprot:XP_013905126.1 hypothetical protein MNEG_1845 [Monoraphidium neglectum]